MAKLIVILLGMVSYQMALASNKPPFVGERYFNFAGGNITEQLITIDPSGHVSIVSTAMTGEPQTDYQGKYKTLMCNEQICYKIINKNQIALTNKKGQVQGTGCYTATGKAIKCVVKLEQP